MAPYVIILDVSSIILVYAMNIPPNNRLLS